MAKFIVILFLSLFIISTVFAVDVAYVVKSSHSADTHFLNMLREKNMSYEVIIDDNLDSGHLSKYSVIVIGDDKIKNIKKIPTDAHVIIMNRHHASYFGFIEKGNVLQFSSNGNVKINKKNKKMEVYTRPFYNLKKIGLPVYYLPTDFVNENKTESVAVIEAGSRKKEGSVIAYKEDKCFFGIPASEFWTADIKKLFEDCIMHVVQSGKHDVKIDEALANSVNGIRIKNELDQYLTNETALLECNKKYKVDFRTVNIGSFSEDINFTGKLGSLTWSAEKEDLPARESTTAGSKTISVNITGDYDLIISANIKNDNYLGDNTKIRKVKVAC